MAKKKAVSSKIEPTPKSHLVKQWIADHPTGTCKECVAALAGAGVRSTDYYNAKSKLGKKKTKRKTRKQAISYARASVSNGNGSSASLDQQLKATHAFLASIGGRKHVKTALDTYDRVSQIFAS